MSKRLSRKALDQRNMALVGMGYPIEEPRQVSRLLRKERVQTGAQEKPPLWRPLPKNAWAAFLRRIYGYW
jgi:hypothetical protein